MSFTQSNIQKTIQISHFVPFCGNTVMIRFLSVVLVSQKPDLNYIQFTWNKMTASDFEEHWKVKKMTKKADFIHMIQVGVAGTVLVAPRLCF